jgi:hypothetical protein
MAYRVKIAEGTLRRKFDTKDDAEQFAASWNGIVSYESVARICEEPGGYVVSDDALDFIDARGRHYRSRREGIAAAREAGYTHYIDPNGKQKAL